MAAVLARSVACSGAVAGPSSLEASSFKGRLGQPVSFSRSAFSGSRISTEAVVSSSRVQAAVTAPHLDQKFLKQVDDIASRIRNAPENGVGVSYDDFTAALSNFDFSFELGDMVRGTVFAVDKNGAYVDVGAKATAFLPISEASIYKLDRVEDAGVVPGMELEFMVVRDNDEDGMLTLSLRRIQYEVAWERCRQELADDMVVKGKVVSVNRGGVVVLVEGLRGFVPSSHLALKTPREELVEKEIPLKFLEVDEDDTRLVLSNRRAMAETQLQSFKVGDVVVGVVQAVMPYGAFVDIGGVNGLLHVSQISHDRVMNVNQVLAEGDKLKVMILSQDRDRGRISLSTKKLEPTPGDMLRNPALVYEKADDMAQSFRDRVAALEAEARAEERRLQGGVLGDGDFDDEVPSAEVAL